MYITFAERCSTYVETVNYLKTQRINFDSFVFSELKEVEKIKDEIKLDENNEKDIKQPEYKIHKSEYTSDFVEFINKHLN